MSFQTISSIDYGSNERYLTLCIYHILRPSLMSQGVSSRYKLHATLTLVHVFKYKTCVEMSHFGVRH